MKNYKDKNLLQRSDTASKVQSKPKFTRGDLPYWLVTVAVITRFLPHPPNFTAVGSTALYSGRYLAGPWRYMVPMVAMLISDFFLGWHKTMIFVYGALLFNVWLGGKVARHPKWYNILGGAGIASLVFYLVTNLGVWLTGTWYPHTISGLISCYVAAIPFAKWTLIGDLSYTVALFGTTELLLYYQKKQIVTKGGEIWPVKS